MSNQSRLVISIFLVSILILGGSDATFLIKQAKAMTPTAEIPNWVKNNAKWWAEGHLSDADFIKGIQYMVQQGLITVPPTAISSNPNTEIPSWFKGTAKWWALGQVSDADFITSIQYLIENGIIVVPTQTTPSPTTTTQSPTTNMPGSTTTEEYQPYTNTQYGFSFEYPKGWSLRENFGPNYSIQSVVVSPDENLQLFVGVLKNNNPYSGLTTQEILGDVTGLMRNACSKSTFDTRGFTCTNPQFTSNVTSYHGVPLYEVAMFWTKTFSNGTSIRWDSVWGVVPSGADVWLMIIESSADEFVKYQDEISHIGDSLNVYTVGTTTSGTTPQGGTTTPGTTPQGGTANGGTTPSSVYSSKEAYCQAKYGSNVHYDSSLNSCVSYGGYNTPEEYCQGKYGSDYHYDPSSNKCVSYNSYNSPDEYCQGTYGPQYHYDSSTNTCMPSTTGGASSGQQSSGQQGGGGTSNGGSTQGGGTPGSAGIDLTGTWQGNVKGSGSYSYINQKTGNQEQVNCQYSGPITFTLTQNGNDLTGNVAATVSITGDPDCQQVPVYPFQGALSATIFGSGFSGTVGTLNINGQFTSDLLRGTIGGNIGVIPVQGQFTASRTS